MVKTILIALLLLMNTAFFAFPQEGEVKVTYIANAGFMIERSNKKILIDALFTSVGGYQNPPDTVLHKILNGLPPFNNLSLLLVTHNHADHFNDSLVIRFLNLNPEVPLMAPEEVIRKILSDPRYKQRPQQLIHARGINQNERDTVIRGVKVNSFFLQHDNRPEIENLGYLIGIDGLKILHTGDCTGCNAADFELLRLPSRGIDLALLNYYGFWETPEDRRFATTHIKPGKIILYHIPPDEVKSVKEKAAGITDFIPIIVFERSMEFNTHIK